MLRGCLKTIIPISGYVIVTKQKTKLNKSYVDGTRNLEAIKHVSTQDIQGLPIDKKMSVMNRGTKLKVKTVTNG